MTEIALKEPGIIIVSEELRKQLGLIPGMSLIVEEIKDGIRLRVQDKPDHLVYEDRVLVFTGELLEPVEDFVQVEREQRLSTLLP